MAEVLIIGGGISGVAAAHALAVEGVRVTLMEQHGLAAMASGWTLAGVRQSGRHPAELPLAQAAVEIWANLDEELDAETDYRRRGNLRLARNEEEAATLRDLVEQQRALGLDLDLLDGNEAVRAVAPALSEAVVAASFCPSDGHADPIKTVHAFAAAATRLGAEIRLGEGVEAILVEGGRVAGVRTATGEHCADRVVLAAGIRSADLLRPHGLSLPIEVKMVTVVRTVPLPPLLDQVLGTAAAVFAGRQEAGGQLRMTGGVGLWHGDLTTGEDGRLRVRPPLRAVQGLIERAGVFVPAFGEAPLDLIWAGLIDMTPDGLPVIDASPEIEGLVIAAGFSGHGFGIGPVIGRLIRDLVIGRPPNLSLAAFRRDRFDERAAETAATELLG